MQKSSRDGAMILTIRARVVHPCVYGTNGFLLMPHNISLTPIDETVSVSHTFITKYLRHFHQSSHASLGVFRTIRLFSPIIEVFPKFKLFKLTGSSLILCELFFSCGAFNRYHYFLEVFHF